MLVETFNLDCRYRREHKITHNRTRPFIIIEGDHRKNQDAVGRVVAKQLNAKYVTHPAYCIAKYLKVLPRGSFLLRAFFHLSNYAANYYARYLHNWTVVLNGYWMDQLRQTVLNTYEPDKLPPAESDILTFPEDLLPPDVTFFLEMPDTSHPNSPSGEWKRRTKDLMNILQTRYAVEFRPIEPDIDLTIDEVLGYTVGRLGPSIFAPHNHSETVVPEVTTEDDYC